MKVQILRLDAQDDLASIQDRIACIQAGRVILVWPKEGHRLQRRLDLMLLQRQAERRGAQLGLVTRDPTIQDHARLLGIPLLKSEDSLDQEAWRRGRRSRTSFFRPPAAGPLPEPPPRRATAPPTAWNRITHWIVFAAAMLAPLTLAAALLPSAEITIHPTTETHSAQVTLTLDPEAEALSEDGVLPAREIAVSVSGEQRIETTAMTLQPGPAAIGEVVFTNLTDDAVSIPAESGLRAGGADGPRFFVTTEMSVFPGRGQQVIAPVQARDGGPQGNLPSGAIDTVDGPLGLLVSVANPQPTSGGALIDRPSVAVGDQQRLESALRADLLAQARLALQDQLGPEERVAEASLDVVGVSQRDFDHAIGEPTDSMGLAMTIDVAALAYSESDAEAAARLALRRDLAPDRNLVDESVTLDIPPNENPDEASRLTVEARGSTFRKIDLDRAARLCLAQPPEVAAERLDSAFHLDERPRITLSPSWLPRLPFLQHRIRFSFNWETP